MTVRDDVPSLDVTEGADTGILLTTQDAETDGSPTNEDTATAAAGAVTAGFAGVFGLTFDKGADGGATPALSYALAVTSATSGLTSHNAAINLFKVSDGLIVGSTAAANPGAIDGTAVFSVSVAADGTVTLTQYQQIDHAAEATPVPGTDAPFDDQFASLADGLITLTASSSLTDGDGDVASDSETVSIGANLRFADDGPALSNVAAGVGVTLDETTAGANFLAPINGTSATAVITATSAFGADGPLGNTAAAGTAYGLALTGAGATSLKTAIGDFPITLVQTAANVIAGQYTDGTTKTAFTLTIGTDGKLTVVQNVALEHDQDGNTAGDYDDALNLAGLVNATITLTDFDGDTATQSAAIGNLVVFEDDGVDAVLDTGMVPAGSSAAIMGNVLGNDYRGADGSAISGVTNVGAATTGTLAAGEFTIQGQHGSLTVNATTGAYTYTRTAGAGGGANDVFTYTLTDNDGDFDTATLTISIGDLTPVAGVADATVDDEGLSGGIAGGTGDIDANTPAGRTADLDPASTEAVFKGTLGSGTPSSVPGDGANVYLFLAAQTATTIGQETVTYSVSPDGSLLTATIATSPAGRTGTLFTVQITDPATGAYTLTLGQPVLHAAAGTENDVDISLAYQLRDADLDTSVANGSLSIKFDDDVPTASTVTNTAQTDDEGKAPFAALSNEGAAVGTDVAGSPATATGAAGSLFAIGADGLGSIAITGPAGVMAIYDADADGDAQQEALVYSTSAPAPDGSVTLTATGALSNQVAFTLQVGADGSYTFTQVRALVHTGAGEDERNLAFGFTATDKDGDAANGSLTVAVDDDTPTAKVVVAAALTDDEGKAPFASSSIEGATVGADVAGSPATVTGTAGALFAAGADGFGSVTLTPPTLLKAITTGTASGTTGTSRQEDVVYDAPAVAANGAVTVTARGVTSGEVVFTLTVNPDGSYSFTQSRALVHSGAGEDDKALSFGFTLTDGDGDTATGSLRIDVDDDTPANFTPAAATAINTGTAVIAGQLLDTAGNGIFDNAGADGIASITFAPAIHGTKLSGPGGLLQSGGADIYLYIQPNGSLIASTDADPTNGLAAGTTVFTATLNAGTGTYTIDFDKTIDNGSGTKVADFSAAAAGNTPWKGVDPDILNNVTLDIADPLDPNPDSTDLLFTPIGGGAQNTINSDSDDIGVGTGQRVDAPEALRIDLVQDLRRDGALDESTPGSYLYDTHTGVTQFTFKLVQVNGGPSNTSTVRILASNVDDANLISQADVTSPLINTPVNLDHTTVIVKNAAGVVTTAGIAVFDDGNNIIVTGLKTGYTVSFGAQGNLPFEAVTIENGSDIIKTLPATTYGGDTFSLGGFAFSFVAIGAPVAFDLPVVLTDGDGDTAAGNIAVTVNPVTPVVLDLDGDGVEFATSAAGAVFDYNGDGNAVATAWAGSDDGILALDANGNGAVDSGAEIVFGANGSTDLEGLAAKYDTNHDGVLDAADADFASFGVWQDADGDGASDAGEFRSLADAGIVSLSLTSDGQAYNAAEGQVHVFGSTVFTRANGSTGTAADASFAVDAKAAQRTAELVTTTAVASAMIVAAGSAMPAAAEETPSRVLPQLEAERVSIEMIDEAAPQGFEARDDLLAGRLEADGGLPEAGAHIRGDTSSAELIAGEHSSGCADPAPDYLSAAHDVELGGTSASLFAGLGAGGEGVMQALLSIAGPQGTGAGLPADPVAGLEAALSDFTGEGLVNAIVDHFAGRVDTSALPLSANDDGSHLLAQGIAGSGGFTGFAPLPDAGDDASALAAAQA